MIQITSKLGNKWALLAIALATIGSRGTYADSSRNAAQYNLDGQTGLKGYDPVAVFPEGGGSALPGETRYSYHYDGVVYLFANLEHLTQFQTNPDKYEPTYGGWCAYAMASGSKVDIQPTLFTIHGNRAHYFVSARAKRSFDADIVGYENRADDQWKNISGEFPRR